MLSFNYCEVGKWLIKSDTSTSGRWRRLVGTLRGGWWPWVPSHSQSLPALAAGCLLWYWTGTTLPPVWRDFMSPFQVVATRTLLIFSLLWLRRLGKCSSAPWVGNFHLLVIRGKLHAFLKFFSDYISNISYKQTWLRTVCVWSSVPVTMLPTARKAAVWTFTCITFVLQIMCNDKFLEIRC